MGPQQEPLQRASGVLEIPKPSLKPRSIMHYAALMWSGTMFRYSEASAGGVEGCRVYKNASAFSSPTQARINCEERLKLVEEGDKTWRDRDVYLRRFRV